MRMPRHDQPLWKSGVQAPIRTHPAQLALRTVLLGEVPRNLQASARPQPGLLEMALSIARAGNPEKIDLKRDDFSSNRHPALSFCLSMIFSENRCTLFRIML
jgi:hypothetical protein